MAHPPSGFSSTVSRSSWNLKVLIFLEQGKSENLMAVGRILLGLVRAPEV